MYCCLSGSPAFVSSLSHKPDSESFSAAEVGRTFNSVVIIIIIDAVVVQSVNISDVRTFELYEYHHVL